MISMALKDINDKYDHYITVSQMNRYVSKRENVWTDSEYFMCHKFIKGCDDNACTLFISAVCLGKSGSLGNSIIHEPGIMNVKSICL